MLRLLLWPNGQVSLATTETLTTTTVDGSANYLWECEGKSRWLCGGSCALDPFAIRQCQLKFKALNTLGVSLYICFSYCSVIIIRCCVWLSNKVSTDLFLRGFHQFIPFGMVANGFPYEICYPVIAVNNMYDIWIELYLQLFQCRLENMWIDCNLV